MQKEESSLDPTKEIQADEKHLVLDGILQKGAESNINVPYEETKPIQIKKSNVNNKDLIVYRKRRKKKKRMTMKSRRANRKK